MKHTTGHFEGVGDCSLYFSTWLPDDQPKAALSIVHGVGEHIDRYGNLVDVLVPDGYALFGYDQRGHGRSGGRRGHINAWTEYRGDLTLFMQRVSQQTQDLPRFLFGHSMGALVVLDYLIHQPHDLAGAILSGTPIEPADAAPPHLAFLAQILSRVWPTFSLNQPIPGSSVSCDPHVAHAYDTDPLVESRRSARWGAESLRIVKEINRHPDAIDLPVLFIHGGLDRLVTAEGARRFFDRIPYPDKTFQLYPESRHEPHNDLNRRQVVHDIESWMEAHIDAGGE
jgi:alpha-beta hydrolase superfamily lysophospholipase